MTASKSFRNIIILVLIAIIIMAPLSTQAQESDQTLRYVPDNALFCIRINNFNNSIAKVDQFVSGVYPVNLSALVQGLLPNMLGSPELAGLNMNGSITAFGVILDNQAAQSPGTLNIFAGIIVPVSNYQQFINGIANKIPADDKGIVKLPALQNILVTQLDNNAIMTWETNYDNLIKFKNLMGAGTSASAQNAPLSTVLDSSEAKLATSEPVWIYGNIEQAAKTFGPMITAGLEGIKATVANLPSTQTGMEPADIQNVMKMYISIIDTVMKETKSVSISINPTPNALNVTKVVNTIQGTDMAKMFSSNSTAKANDLLPYLENGSMMNFAFSLNSPIWTETIDLQVKLLSMLSGEEISKEFVDKMKTLTASMLDCISGNAAYTFSEDTNLKPPFKGKYIIGVKDEKKFQQIINEAFEMMNSTDLLGIYKNMGMDVQFKIERNVETYKGVSIDSAKFSMKFDESNNPQAQMIENMYGDGFDYRWAVTNGLFAAAIGSDADKTIHELIDQIQSGQAKQICSETQAALSLLPGAEKADFFFTMNVLRLMKMGLSMTGSMLPIPLPSLDNVQTKSNIAISGTTDNGKITIQLAVPKEHIQEIMTTIMTIQQQMTQSQASAKL